MAGRPTSLSPEVQKKICDAIAAGNYYQAACSYAGIEYQTFRNWMKAGKDASEGPFFDFFLAVLKAEADAEVRVVAQWQQQIPANWAAARDFLARRYPSRWGPRETVTVLKKLADEVESMSNEDLDRFLAGTEEENPPAPGREGSPPPRTEDE